MITTEQLLKSAISFSRNTKRSRDGCTITCRRGLWFVKAPTPEEAIKEAQRYFLLYWLDGEYEDGEEG